MSGRTVIVTGASSGIGEAAAKAFARAGDRVVLTARRVERLEQLAAGMPETLIVPADLTKAEDITRIVFETLARYDRIDVLVNNAGLGRYDWIERLSDADIRTEIAVNLMAPILLTRAVLPSMLARRSGVIINVGSAAGRIATPTMAIYNATKFGLDGFTEALRRELRPRGIHLCVIYPGGVAGTEFGDQSKRASLGLTTPRWLLVTADQVAREIVGLADRPRARRVIPAIYGAAMALNALLPSLVDFVVMRATRRAQAARPAQAP